MTEEEKKKKLEHDDMVRFADFLLQMINKYGAEIMEDKKKEAGGDK